MSIIVFQPEPLRQYPPTVSLLSILAEKYNVVFISCADNSGYTSFFKEKKIKNTDVIKKLRFRNGYFPALFERYRNIKQLLQVISDNYSDESIIWFTTDKAAVYLGNKMKDKRYIMQLMELIQVEEVNNIFPLAKKVNLKKIAQKAKVLVSPEYNRSRIQSVWWDLKIPSRVLPNKQHLHPRTKNMNISDLGAKKIVEEILSTGKKIILYQGVFHKQRSLGSFIKACERLSEKYIFLIMGMYTPAVEELLKLSSVVKHIPWIDAPMHLEITSMANIGILSYLPGKFRYVSELNALYCAPNKIYEYSGFGIPMLANDCPPLRTAFDHWNIGKIVDLNDIDSIISGIDHIERNYSEMTSNCMDFFDSFNMHEIIDDIISTAKC